MRADTERRIASRTHPVFQLFNAKPVAPAPAPPTPTPDPEPATVPVESIPRTHLSRSESNATGPTAALITVGDRSLSLDQWMDVLGVARSTLYYRARQTKSMETAIAYYRALSVLPGRPKQGRPQASPVVKRKPANQLLHDAIKRHGGAAALIERADAALALTQKLGVR